MSLLRILLGKRTNRSIIPLAKLIKISIGIVATFVVLLNVFVAFQIKIDVNKQLYEYASELISMQESQFADEIYTMKEKALAIRIQNLTSRILAKSPESTVCSHLESIFNNQEYKTWSCSSGDITDFKEDQGHEYWIWIGNDRGGIVRVLIKVKASFVGLLTSSISLIIGILIISTLAFWSFFKSRVKTVQSFLQIGSSFEQNQLEKLASRILEFSNKMEETNGHTPYTDSSEKLNKPDNVNENKIVDGKDNSSFQQRELYESIANVVRNSLELWKKATNKDKIALAEESALWTVSVDKGTLRTVTLDKYLRFDKIPSRPRTHIVIDTAKFVLKNTEGFDELRKRIEIEIEKIKSSKY